MSEPHETPECQQCGALLTAEDVRDTGGALCSECYAAQQTPLVYGPGWWWWRGQRVGLGSRAERPHPEATRGDAGDG
jgi:hypothetical protein